MFETVVMMRQLAAPAGNRVGTLIRLWIGRDSRETERVGRRVKRTAQDLNCLVGENCATSAMPESATPKSATPKSAMPEGATPKSAMPEGATPKGATPRGATAPEGRKNGREWTMSWTGTSFLVP